MQYYYINGDYVYVTTQEPLADRYNPLTYVEFLGDMYYYNKNDTSLLGIKIKTGIRITLPICNTVVLQF